MKRARACTHDLARAGGRAPPHRWTSASPPRIDGILAFFVGWGADARFPGKVVRSARRAPRISREPGALRPARRRRRPESLRSATMTSAVAKRPSRSSPSRRVAALLAAELEGEPRAADELVPLV